MASAFAAVTWSTCFMCFSFEILSYWRHEHVGLTIRRWSGLHSYDIRDVNKKVFYDKSSARHVVIGYGDGYSQIRRLENYQGLRLGA